MLKPAETTPVFTSLTNWKTLEQLVNDNPQFTYSQLKRLFWKRDEHHGLNQCVKRIGRKLYINEPAFALWISGELNPSRAQGSLHSQETPLNYLSTRQC